MLDKDKILNQWTSYKRYYIYLSLGSLVAFIVLCVQIWHIISDTILQIDTSGTALAWSLGLNSIGIIASILLITILQLIFVCWFIFASDTLFALLKKDRLLCNVLNILGIFVFFGLSFIVTPIYLSVIIKNLSIK